MKLPSRKALFPLMFMTMGFMTQAKAQLYWFEVPNRIPAYKATEKNQPFTAREKDSLKRVPRGVAKLYLDGDYSGRVYRQHHSIDTGILKSEFETQYAKENDHIQQVRKSILIGKGAHFYLMQHGPYMNVGDSVCYETRIQYAAGWDYKPKPGYVVTKWKTIQSDQDRQKVESLVKTAEDGNLEKAMLAIREEVEEPQAPLPVGSTNFTQYEFDSLIDINMLKYKRGDFSRLDVMGKETLKTALSWEIYNAHVFVDTYYKKEQERIIKTRETEWAGNCAETVGRMTYYNPRGEIDSAFFMYGKTGQSYDVVYELPLKSKDPAEAVRAQELYKLYSDLFTRPANGHHWGALQGLVEQETKYRGKAIKNAFL